MTHDPAADDGRGPDRDCRKGSQRGGIWICLFRKGEEDISWETKLYRCVIAAVRPIIEAQARAESRREALRDMLDEIRFARIPATAGPKFHYWCGMTEACSMIDKRLKALDTAAAGTSDATEVGQ